MSAFKGTPGPWIHERTVAPRGWNIEARDGTYTVAVARDGSGSLENAANARLIAAAPELLEACQTFAEWLRREDEGLPGGIVRGTPEGEQKWRTWWEENLRICDLAQKLARAAIEKATGGAA